MWGAEQIAHALRAYIPIDSVGRTMSGSSLAPAVVEELQRGTMVLADGTRMPRMGFGTVGVKQAHVATALRIGLRLLDTGEYYRNEVMLTNAIKEAKVDRAQLFIISKAWPFASAKGKSRDFDAPIKDPVTMSADVEQHIKKLGVGYLDVLLLHWPTRGMCAQWKVLQAMQRRGLVRSLGLSNAGPEHLKFLSECSAEPAQPALVQTDLGAIKGDMRVNHTFEDMVAYCKVHGIALMSHSPLSRALKDTRAKELAQRLNVNPAQLVLRYGLQRGIALIFSSKSESHVRSNLAAFDFELNATMMAQIACWRGEQHCSHVHGAVGKQGASPGLRHYQPFSGIEEAAVEAKQALVPGELDPAQRLGRRRPLWRASACSSRPGCPLACFESEAARID